MATLIKLTYNDGHTEDVIPGARARIETERHYQGLGQHNVQEATFRMAWEHLKRTGKITDDWDTWIDTVADIEEKQVADPSPTGPAQPAGTSSGSASAPDSPSPA